jgi:uncharacterized membrane protein YiaA
VDKSKWSLYFRPICGKVVNEDKKMTKKFVRVLDTVWLTALVALVLMIVWIVNTHQSWQEHVLMLVALGIVLFGGLGIAHFAWGTLQAQRAHAEHIAGLKRSSGFTDGHLDP